MGRMHFFRGAFGIALAAALASAHSVTPSSSPFNFVVGGPSGTVTVMNNNMEDNCTTQITWQLTGANPDAVTVAPSPNQGPGVLTTATAVVYQTPPAARGTLTVTPVKAGTLELLVSWVVIVPNPVNPAICSGGATQRIPITVTGPATQPPTTPGPFACTVNAGVPPLVRAEGIAELVGDIIINCTGGIVTLPGSPIPTADFQLFLNTNITSRFYTNSSEALLLIDDPSGQNQRTCGGVCTPPTATAGGINFAQPNAATNGGQQVYNTYQGRIATANSIAWLGIPVNPPGTVGSRVYRITNLRANASQLGASTTLVPSQIVAFISSSNPATLPLTNPQQTVGFIQPGLLFDVRNADNSLNFGSFQQCTSQTPTISGPANFQLRFREAFANAFKVRDISGGPTPGSQAVPGQVYNTETGLYNPALATPQGTPGLANHGTRLRASFNNVPAGVRLFAGTNSLLGSTSIRATLTESEYGAFSAVPATPGAPTGFSEVPIINGTGLAVWEIVSANPTAVEEVNFGLLFSWVANTASNLPSLGTATVNGSLAPLSTAAPTSAIAPIPRFADVSTSRAMFSINPCRTNLLFPFVADTPGFDTGFGISYTPSGLVISNFNADTGPGTGTFPILNQNAINTFNVTVNAGTAPQSIREITSNWLTVDVNQTRTPATATITADPANLAAGTYNGSITIASPEASGPLQIPVRFTVPPLGPFFGRYGVVNAASYHPGVVAPGEAIVIFGKRYGAPELATLLLDPSGLVATTLGETRVFFDDVPAPMIYSSNANGGQVSAFVPFAVGERASTVMRLEYRGARSIEVRMPVADAVPGLFTLDASGGGPGAILHPDFIVVNDANPTAEGGVVLMFGTGAGQTNPGGRDGRLATVPLPGQVLPVKAFFDGVEGEVLYSGPAPGLVEGVLQVNARVPRGVSGAVPVWITAGDKRSQPGVTMAVR